MQVISFSTQPQELTILDLPLELLESYRRYVAEQERSS